MNLSVPIGQLTIATLVTVAFAWDSLAGLEQNLSNAII